MYSLLTQSVTISPYAFCCLLIQFSSIYFCYLLYCKVQENRLSPLLHACKVPTAVWFSFLQELTAKVLLQLM